MKVIYSKDGETVSDFELEDYVIKKFWGNQNIKTSSMIVIDTVRVFIKLGFIPTNCVEYYFEDELIESDDDGRITGWVDGFCDKHNIILETLIFADTEDFKDIFVSHAKHWDKIENKIQEFKKEKGVK